jgi:Ca-activated chloride channel family protein
VLTYNRSNPKVPLVALYPSNGSADADHPYLVLNADWADGSRQEVAKAFLGYLRGPAGRAQILSAGFRDANRAAGAALTQANGFLPKIASVPRAVLLPDSVTESLETWTALTRSTSVLLVLDVSGSMNQAVPGTGKTRLALAKEAARSAVTRFSDDTHVGLWVFSTRLDDNSDHRQVVPLGPLTEPVGSHSRRETLLANIDRLQPGGNTGLYDTAVAAHRAVVDAFRPDATNLVVLMTDGRNEDDTGGLSLDQARDALTRAYSESTRPVKLITVGYGDDADFAALRELSRATKAVSYTSRDAFDINQVLLTAIFGRAA